MPCDLRTHATLDSSDESYLADSIDYLGSKWPMCLISERDDNLRAGRTCWHVGSAVAFVSGLVEPLSHI